MLIKRVGNLKVPFLAVCFSILLVGITACGSTGDSSGDSGANDGSDGVAAAAEAKMRNYMEPITEYPGPTSGPKAQSNKHVLFLSCGMSAEGCSRPIHGAEEAAKILGWETTICDGNFNPTKYASCINTAITSGADGVVLEAIADDLISEPLGRARAAGIEVVSIEGLNESGPKGVSFEVGASWVRQGEALGNFLVWANDGDANVLMQYERSYLSGVAANDAAAKVILEAGGEVEDFNFSESELATVLPSRTTAAVRGDSKINGIMSFDDGILAITPALQQAGLLDQVSTVGWGTGSANLEAIRRGDQGASVGPQQRWEGWAAMDTLNRLFAGEDPVDQNLPIRLFTNENADDVPSDDEGWTGDVDYDSEYKKIWQGDGS